MFLVFSFCFLCFVFVCCIFVFVFLIVYQYLYLYEVIAALYSSQEPPVAFIGLSLTRLCQPSKTDIDIFSVFFIFAKLSLPASKGCVVVVVVVVYCLRLLSTLLIYKI